MYGTQCNDIILNIVFIRMFFYFIFKQNQFYFTLQCELFTSRNVSNNANLLSARTEGGGGQPNMDRFGQGEGGCKNSQICADILYG